MQSTQEKPKTQNCAASTSKGSSTNVPKSPHDCAKVKNSEETKKKIYEELRRRIVEEANFIDPTGYFAENSLVLLDKANLSLAQLEHLNLQKHIFLFAHRQFKRDEPNDVATYVDPVASGVNRRGFDVETIDHGFRFPKAQHYNIPAPHGTVTGVFTGDGSVEDCEIEDLQKWLGCYIKDHQLNTVTIHNKDQDGLANEGSDATVVVANRYFHDLRRMLPALRKADVPVLSINKSYSVGLVFTDQEAYLCSKTGSVMVARPGREEMIYDYNDVLPLYGEYEGYVVNTLVRHGNMRVITFTPGYTDIESEYVPPKDPYQMTGKVSIELPSTPGCIGTYVRPQKEEVRSKLYTFDPEYSTLTCLEPNKWQKFAMFCKHPRQFKKEIVTTAIGVLSVVGMIVNPVSVLGAALAVGGYYASEYIEKQLDTKHVVLSMSPLVFNDKDKHLYNDVLDYYVNHPIDNDTMLPYGSYEITDYYIRQLPQGDPRANYTNVWKLIRDFCSSNGKGAQYTWIGTLQKVMPNLGVDFDREEQWVAAFKPAHDVIPHIISSRVPFTVTIKEKDSVHTTLTCKQELSQYLQAKMDKKTVESIITNRVLAGGIDCVIEDDDLLREWISAYQHYTDQRITYILDEPNIEKYRKTMGRKYKAYKSVLPYSTTWWTDAVYRLFEKLECLAKESIEKKGGRMISPNSKEMNLLIMNFFETFEELLLNFVDDRDGLRIFAKGLNYDQTDDLIKGILTRGAGRWRYIIPIDMKNFDGHFNGKVARVELLFFNWVGLDDSLVEKLMHPRVTGIASYDYLTRKSGDMYTGCGNCMAMLMLLFPFFDRIRILCNGDDTLLFVEDLSVYDEIRKHCYDRGFEVGASEAVEVEYGTGMSYQVPFCQMTYTGGSYDLDHVRMLNKLCNVVSIDLDDSIALKIVGKLQACAVLRNMGYLFDIYPGEFFENFEMSWWQAEKTRYSTGTENLVRDTFHTIRFRSREAGLVGRIVCDLHDHKKVFARKHSGDARRKWVLDVVRKHVKMEKANAQRLSRRQEVQFLSLEAMVDRDGIIAAFPFLARQLAENIADYYGLDLKKVPYDLTDYNYDKLKFQRLDIHRNLTNIQGHTLRNSPEYRALWEKSNHRRDGDGVVLNNKGEAYLRQAMDDKLGTNDYDDVSTFEESVRDGSNNSVQSATDSEVSNDVDDIPKDSGLNVDYAPESPVFWPSDPSVSSVSDEIQIYTALIEMNGPSPMEIVESWNDSMEGVVYNSETKESALQTGWLDIDGSRRCASPENEFPTQFATFLQNDFERHQKMVQRRKLLYGYPPEYPECLRYQSLLNSIRNTGKISAQYWKAMITLFDNDVDLARRQIVQADMHNRR